jgi:uncharacterized membrane protein SirB2
MLEYYPSVRMLHIAAVLLSGCLFFIRGIGLLLGQSWPKARLIRYSTYLIDTVLLTAAVLLMGILQVYPIVHGWLTVKIVCLILYIALGILAFREGGGRMRRAALWLVALALYGFIISVARQHHPLGVLAQMTG